MEITHVARRPANGDRKHVHVGRKHALHLRCRIWCAAHLRVRLILHTISRSCLLGLMRRENRHFRVLTVVTYARSRIRWKSLQHKLPPPSWAFLHSPNTCKPTPRAHSSSPDFLSYLFIRMTSRSSASSPSNDNFSFRMCATEILSCFDFAYLC